MNISKFVKRNWYLVVIALLTLAACSSPASPTPAQQPVAQPTKVAAAPVPAPQATAQTIVKQTQKDVPTATPTQLPVPTETAVVVSTDETMSCSMDDDFAKYGSSNCVVQAYGVWKLVAGAAKFPDGGIVTSLSLTNETDRISMIRKAIYLWFSQELGGKPGDTSVMTLQNSGKMLSVTFTVEADGALTITSAADPGFRAIDPNCMNFGTMTYNRTDLDGIQIWPRNGLMTIDNRYVAVRTADYTNGSPDLTVTVMENGMPSKEKSILGTIPMQTGDGIFAIDTSWDMTSTVINQLSIEARHCGVGVYRLNIREAGTIVPLIK